MAWVGVKYGIPFPIQLRSASGVRGSIIPLLVRAIVSIFWYGVDGYIAAWAITSAAMLVAGVSPDVIVSESLKIHANNLHNILSYSRLGWI